MKNKKALFILLGILTALILGTCIFFALRGVSAAHKRHEYFDVYRDIAEEYIKSDAEIFDKYGSDISVRFDDSVTYRESGERKAFDKYIEVFAPSVPDTIDEFASGIETIKFQVEINGDKYEIAFSHNGTGELVVSSLTLSR